jgi:hypothetical protein
VPWAGALGAAISLVVLAGAPGPAFAEPATAIAPSAPATLACEARGVTPVTDSDYVNRCFTFDETITLDRAAGTFQEERDFNRKACGGWPPFIGPRKGTLEPLDPAAIATGGEGYRLVFDDGWVAELDLGLSISAVFTAGAESFLLSCHSAPALP